MTIPTARAAAPGTRRARSLRLGPVGVAALGVVLVAVVMAVAAPWIAPHDPNQSNLLEAYAPPGSSHWLGTDATGRDIASRLIYGARTSLVGPAAIVVLSLLISVPLALTAAWRGGWTAAVITRTLDVLFAIPGLLLAILAVSLFGPGLRSAVIALGIAYIPYVARLTVTAATAERRLPYVQVLSVQGIGALRISTFHIFRNIAPVLIGQATVAFAYALIDLATLSFLGLGVQAPSSDWGVLVSDRDAVLQGHPGQVTAASVLIVVTVLALFILGSRLSGEKAIRRIRRKRAA